MSALFSFLLFFLGYFNNAKKTRFYFKLCFIISPSQKRQQVRITFLKRFFFVYTGWAIWNSSYSFNFWWSDEAGQWVNNNILILKMEKNRKIRLIFGTEKTFKIRNNLSLWFLKYLSNEFQNKPFQMVYPVPSAVGQ